MVRVYGAARGLAAMVAVLAGCAPGGGTDGAMHVPVVVAGDRVPAAPAFALRWVVTEEYLDLYGNHLVIPLEALDGEDGTLELVLPEPPAEARALYPEQVRAVANLVVLDEAGEIVGGAMSAFLFHSEPLAPEEITGTDPELAATIDGTIENGYNIVSASLGAAGVWDYGAVLDPAAVVGLTAPAVFTPNDLPHAEALIY